MADNYKIVYTGSLKDGVDAEILIKAFMHRFKVPEKSARKLLNSGHAVTLKTNLDASTAERYRQTLERLGILVRVEHENAGRSDAGVNSDTKFIGDEPDGKTSRNEHACSQCGAQHFVNGVCLSCEDDSEIEASEKSRSFGYKLNMFIATKLRVIFPPLSELTVFVFAVTLYTAPIYIEGFPSPFQFISMLLSVVIEIARQSVSDFFKMLFFGPIAIFFVLSLIVGPLMLPFTKVDLRWTYGLAIGVFALVVAVSSIFGFVNEPGQLLNRLIMIYSISWIAYLLYILRFVEEPGFILGDDQADALTASISAVVSVVLVFAATKFYAIKWYTAFVIGITSSASIVPLVMKIIYAPIYMRNSSKRPSTDTLTDQ